MNEIRRILDQMDRAFHGEAWHGPSLMSLLEGVSAEDASKHTIHGVHSIWELVNHIAAWHTVAQHRLAGETVDVPQERDWPHVWEVTETAWKRALDDLAESRARLRKAAEALRDSDLDQIPAGTSVSRYQLLHGVVQHDLYHAGQIAILKKALG